MWPVNCHGLGMNLLANLSPTYRQSLLARTRAGQHGNRPVSPYTEMMDTLQALKQSDPNLYQRVKQETISYLQASARRAEAAFDIRLMAAGRRGA
jgi:hypothetical protein